MLDALLHKQVSTHLSSLTAPLSQKNISPNLITVAGFILGIAGCFCVGMAFYIPGLILLLLNRFADLLDGVLAHQTGQETARGFYLNLVLTRIIYAAFLFLFAMSSPINSMAAAFVLFTYAAMNASSLTGELIAQKQGTASPSAPFIGNTEITIFMILCCLMPDTFSMFAAVIGIAGCVSVFNDVWKAMRRH